MFQTVVFAMLREKRFLYGNCCFEDGAFFRIIAYFDFDWILFYSPACEVLHGPPRAGLWRCQTTALAPKEHGQRLSTDSLQSWLPDGAFQWSTHVKHIFQIVPT